MFSFTYMYMWEENLGLIIKEDLLIMCCLSSILSVLKSYT